MHDSAANETQTTLQDAHQPLTRNQIRGFWASWGGWTLDGMDSFVYALVLVPSLAVNVKLSGPEYMLLGVYVIFAPLKPLNTPCAGAVATL